jgi:hypothetical protein
MDKLKCSFCGGEAVYSMGVVTDNGYIENNACDQHRFAGAVHQDGLVNLEELKSRIRLEAPTN